MTKQERVIYVLKNGDGEVISTFAAASLSEAVNKKQRLQQKAPPGRLLTVTKATAADIREGKRGGAVNVVEFFGTIEDAADGKS